MAQMIIYAEPYPKPDHKRGKLVGYYYSDWLEHNIVVN
jgi:hypothetical protein